MVLQAFTLFHVAVSLAAIAAGFAVIYGLLANRILTRATTFFLAATAVTSISGYFFPFHGVTPAQILGAISLVVLALAYFARKRLVEAGRLRRTYVVTLVVSLYLNFFVLIVQLFQKAPALKALAPTQTEAPFKIAQGVALLLFIVLGIAAAVRFRGRSVPAGASV